MKITRIRIPSNFNTGTGFQTALADFRLGVGPCGKEVVSLDTEVDSSHVTVMQRTRDGECKSFLYPTHTLTGRIEVTARPDYLGDDIPGDPSPPLDPNAGVPSGS